MVRGYLDELRRTVKAVQAANDPAFGMTGSAAGRSHRQPRPRHHWLLGKLDNEPQSALAGATPYLRLFGNAAGGCMLADEALAAIRLADRSRLRASPLRGSLPRTSRCRPPVWSAR